MGGEREFLMEEGGMGNEVSREGTFTSWQMAPPTYMALTFPLLPSLWDPTSKPQIHLLLFCIYTMPASLDSYTLPGLKLIVASYSTPLGTCQEEASYQPH